MLHHEETKQHKLDFPDEKEKSMLEIYKEIGSVNGPGWRPMPNRKALETSVVEISTVQES